MNQFQRYILMPILWIALTALNLSAATIDGLVVGVHDGDTLTLLDIDKRQIKVRLTEIDAPESSQDYGQRSKQSLSDLAFGKHVRVDKETVDRYGRTVGRVFVAGQDINATQVQRGMAWVYRQYAHRPELYTIEKDARSSKRGLWAKPRPVPPWEYRNGRKPSVAEKEVEKRTENPNKTERACGTKHTCGEMSSCEEARFYLQQCGMTRLDRDRDGIPCESLCR